MIVGLIWLAMVAAPANGCHFASLEKVVRDQDSTAPLVVMTAAGERFRMYGSDFIDPRRWRSGDRLKVCAVPPPSTAIEITDQNRGEKIEARYLGARRR